MAIYHTTLRGRLGSGPTQDIFSHSLGIQSGDPEPVVAQAIVDSWRTAWTGAGAHLGAYFNSATIYEEATVARVIDPMVPDLGAAAHAPFSPPLQGEALGLALPPQNAVAVSLKAGVRPNGTPFRGRFFLPAPVADFIGAEGYLDITFQNDILALVNAHFARLAAAGHYASIWSRTVEDLVNYVSEVRVGNKVDTIRSRRNAVPETYVVAGVPGPQ